MISGQIIARINGAETEDGRDLVILFGIVAAPKGTFKSEHQYTVYGPDGGERLLIHPESDDVSKHTIGNSVSGIICSPIWRY
jgi:hypothetical protein